MIGPEQDVPWPDGAAWLEYEPKVAAVLGLETSNEDPFEPSRHLFGYTLVSDWQARDASGAPVVHADGVPIAIGPCVVTADEVDPQVMFLEVRVDGDEVGKGNLNGTATSLFRAIDAASRRGPLGRGDALALNPFRRARRTVARRRGGRLGAEGIGTLPQPRASAGVAPYFLFAALRAAPLRWRRASSGPSPCAGDPWRCAPS